MFSKISKHVNSGVYFDILLVNGLIKIFDPFLKMSRTGWVQTESPDSLMTKKKREKEQ